MIRLLLLGDADLLLSWLGDLLLLGLVERLLLLSLGLGDLLRDLLAGLDLDRDLDPEDSLLLLLAARILLLLRGTSGAAWW